MNSLQHSLLSLSGRSPSDLLRSSSNSFNGVPLITLAKARFVTRRSATVSAKIGKGKKNDSPWPDEIDPNAKGGYVGYLSEFKKLTEKPKPVTLSFEKPLVDLKKKIMDVRKMAEETGLDFSDQITSLEIKYHQALEDLYTHLTPIERLNIARHPNRPTFLDHVLNITDKWVELHGDRAGYDDPAIVTGIGSIDGKSYMFIGHQKGRNTKENIKRNFGMPTPHGYRKALRMMRYADHHGFPIITFVDTPGAYADLNSEGLGQGEAIAFNLREMFGLKVPMVSVVIGEGGSGGALAICCANKLFMLQNSVFYVASPEACAAILWKTAKASPKAAERLKITATELCKLKIADGIIPEPLGGAHVDPSGTSQQIKTAVLKAMKELEEMDTETLLHHRMLKFRSIGGFQEGMPVPPEKKFNMKKKDEPILEAISSSDGLTLEDEIEKVKQQVLKGRDPSEPPSSQPLDLSLNEMIEKLKREVDQEYAEAIKFLGLEERLKTIRKEVTEARNSSGEKLVMDSSLKDKIEKLSRELKQGLEEAPNYPTLSYKLDMLKEIKKAKKISDQNEKVEKLKPEMNKKLQEALDKPEVKEKFELLKEEIKSTGVLTVEELDEELKKKFTKLKGEIQLELGKALEAMGLDVQAVIPKEETLRAEMIEGLKREVDQEFDEAIKFMGLEERLETIGKVVMEARNSSGENLVMDPLLKDEIEKLSREFKQGLEGAPNYPSLSNKLDMLMKEIKKAKKLSDQNEKVEKLKPEIYKKLQEALDKPEVKEKIDLLKEEVKSRGVSTAEELDEELKEKVRKLKGEIQLELGKALEMNDQIQKGIEEVVSTSDLKNKLKMLEMEAATLGEEANSDLETRIEEVKRQIKERLMETLDMTQFGLKQEDGQDGEGLSRVEVNVGAMHDHNLA
ncbi:hypothetical protein AMTRI_Chr08g202420 [Amborella trichopoda]|uniref:acetyl-CoA carboxytransferase n=1 Tax=Amborella trichopoda TaxID=13333 RepID=W1PPN7_AMBTC|nr:acetyl-coenzyme A carboxylase carboxyl transferase subunit alpha, chloroplastic [Amborella trichopoda]ERN09661.1 hypothetical protein AMTR_s00029p00204330 [Amborella trichopoda]|eukprot:XP_006848080.1 acetyl-coenzyme A carboxylase carboxyl transferase subunit alpha, chloroplastic [Amborella trichopoda]